MIYFSLLLIIIYFTVDGQTVLNISRSSWKWPDSGNLKLIENNSPFFHLFKHKYKIRVIEKIPTTAIPLSVDCICVPYYQCNSNNTIITDGIGIIDVRIRQCTGDLEVCCKVLNLIPKPPSSMAPIVIPTTIPTSLSTLSSTPSSTLSSTQPQTSQPSTLSSTQSTQQSITLPVQPLPTSPSYNCICVNRSHCDANGFIIIGGEGIINPRQTQYPCTSSKQICCRLPTNSINFPSTPAPVPPPVPVSVPIPAPIFPSSSCICVKIHQCNANGFVIVSGVGILPRFPSYRQGQIINICMFDEICCRLQQPTTIVETQQNITIGFPIGPGTFNTTGINPRANFTNVSRMPGDIKNHGTHMECICVKSWLCSSLNVVMLDAAGIIDSRFSYCMAVDEVCCRTLETQSMIQSVGSGNNFTIIQNNVISTSSNNLYSVCGISGQRCLPEQCPREVGQTYFSEFPWMVAIIAQHNNGSGLFLCGGSMVNNRAVLTAAHCVLNRERGLLVARFGEWNTANNAESLPYQESVVQSIVTHPNYYKDGLYHDVAVLILSTPVQIAINVQPICLPQQGMLFTPGMRCLASGWGRSGFDGQYQTTLRKIHLPLVEVNECQKLLRLTKLGEYFQLHPSFLCAGGEVDKDTCTGDGGGPLVCPTSTGQYVQVGIVSWGIGCGQNNVPAVYADVAKHRQWIDQQLANYGVS